MHSEVNGLVVSRNGNCLGRQLEESCGDVEVHILLCQHIFQ
jgi:hypothetical protein